MANFSFDPGLLSEWDDLLLKKKKEEARDNILFRKQATMETLNSVTDGDTVNVGADENLRLNDLSGGQVNAPETDHGTGQYAPHNAKQRENDAMALAANLGIPPSMVTDEMLFGWGEEVKAKQQELLMQDQPDPSAPQVQVTRQPRELRNNLSLEQQGDSQGRDKYGRTLGELVNPFTGVNVNEALNTPEYNPAFYDERNVPNANNYARVGDTEEKLFSYSQNPDGTYNFAAKGALKDGQNEAEYKVFDPLEVYAKQDRGEEIGWGAAILGPYGPRLEELTGLDLVNEEDYMRTQGGRYDPFVANNLSEEEFLDHVKAFEWYSSAIGKAKVPVGYDTEKGQVIYGEMPYKGYVPDEALKQDVGTGTEMLYRSLGSITKFTYDVAPNVAKLTDRFSKLITDKELIGEENIQRLADALDTTYIVEMQGRLTGPEQMIKQFASERLAFSDYLDDLFSNRKEAAFSALADSAGMMAAFTVGIPGLVAVGVDTNERIVESFKQNLKANGEERDLTWEEQGTIAALAMISTAAEKFGYEALMGRAPGLKTWLAKQTAKSPAIVRFLGTTTAGTILGFAGEGTSGFVSGQAEELGSKVDQLLAGNPQFMSSAQAREAFWMEAMPGGMISAGTSTIRGATTSSDAAVLSRLRSELAEGQGVAEMTEKDLSSTLTQLGKVNDKLDDVELSEPRRAKLTEKKLELEARVETGLKRTGKPLNAAGQARLTDAITTLETRILAREEAKLKNTVRTDNEAETTETTTAEPAVTFNDVGELTTQLENARDLDNATNLNTLEKFTQAVFELTKEYSADRVTKEDMEIAIRNLKRFEEEYNNRADTTTERETVSQLAAKNEYVYSLDTSNTNDAVTGINALIQGGTLTEAETSIVETKLKAIQQRADLDKQRQAAAKDSKRVNKDIIGENGEGSADYISFNNYLDDIRNNKNVMSAMSKLEAFNRHMNGKAKALREAFTTYQQTGVPQKVEFRGKTYNIGAQSQAFVELVESEAAYGNTTLELARSTRDGAEMRDAEASVSEMELQERDTKRQSINQLIQDVEARVGDTVESPAPGSQQSINEQITETVEPQQETQNSPQTPRPAESTAPPVQGELFDEAEQAQPVEAEANVEQLAEPAEESTPQAVAEAVKSMPLVGQTVDEIQTYFKDIGAATKNAKATIKAVNTLSYKQWKAIAEKLGVLPDGCR